MSILFITKKRDVCGYGYGTFGLLNSARFVAKRLVKEGIRCHVAEVHDNNDIEREVVKFKPKHVIIEALWVVPLKVELLAKLYPKIKWVIRIHSRPAFLSNEQVAFDWIRDYQIIGKRLGNVFISVNNEEFNDDLNVLDIKSVYLPNIYEVDYPAIPHHMDKHPDILDFSVFGAIRIQKNHLVQAMAAIAYANQVGKKLRLHVNGTRCEQRGESVLKNLRGLFRNSGHELVEHIWYSHQQFLGVLQKMDMSLQVSSSESFNIVAADSVFCGLPIVVSHEITWLPFYTKADHNSQSSIVKAISRNAEYGFGLISSFMTNINKNYLKTYNDDSTQVWLNALYAKN